MLITRIVIGDFVQRLDESSLVVIDVIEALRIVRWKTLIGSEQLTEHVMLYNLILIVLERMRWAVYDFTDGKVMWHDKLQTEWAWKDRIEVNKSSKIAE